MAASPAKFFFGFLIVSIVLWMIFILCSRLFAWMLSRVLGASVVFRIGGWKCLKDVVVKFKKGAIESVSASEIKLSLRQSLVKLGVGFLSRDPKVQVLVSDLEVVMRSSTSTTNLQKAKSQKSRTSGRGKWMVVANVARFLSLSIADMVVKTRKVIVEVKELKLDINKDGGTKPNLYVKLNVLPILVHLCESRIISDQSSNVSFESCTSPQASSASPDRSSAALFCDELSLSSEFGHDRAVGIVVRNVEVISGDVILNFDEDSFPKSKQSSAPVHSDEVRASATVASFAKKPHKENQLLAALAKYSPSFPDKVSFSLPKLDVRCVNREHDLLAENNITGIHLRSVKSKSFEDTGESTRLDVQMELSEIHFFKEAEASILEIMKVDVVSFIYIPIQPVLPVRAEVDIKLGGTRCNLFISRLQPWLRLHFLRKKKLVLQEKAHTLEKTKAADMKAIMWTGTVSAPEMTVMLYGIDDSPMYHFCSQSSHVFANNISSLGTSVHVELGELNLHLADEYQECFKEHLFGIEPNSGSLMHIAKISLDWGRRDRTSSDEVGFRSKLQSYYQACQGLAPSEGSGACREGFQAGFKPSATRTSLLSVCATDFDLSLTAVHGGDAGLIEVLKKLDPICQENDIPFSRLYGSNVYLNTGCLVVQLRNYTLPLLSGTSGKCEGRIVLAQQATCFQPQISQDVFVGRWRKVRMFRSASGTTPPLKTYSDLRIHFEQGEVSFGVGYEPAFADISYAFTVALRRANLSHRNPGMAQVVKKERSLPWWDDMRNYVHGNITLSFSESNWSVLATTDPYESLDKLQIVTGPIELQQSDGRVFVNAKDFKIKLSSLESLISRHSLKVPVDASKAAFIEAPDFNLEVTMDWDCESGNSLNHYLYAFPAEGKPREKVFDPFRSTSLSLRWNFSLRPEKFHQSSSGTENPTDVGTVYISEDKPDSIPLAPPVMNLGAHDLAWILKFWGMNYYPPHKLRSFSRWPRFGVARAARSGNLSMDKVMTEFMLRVDATPSLIKYMPWDSDDPAKGLTFNMAKLKYELCYSRGKQKYTFECKRDALDLVYQGLDLHVPKAFINKDEHPCIPGSVQFLRKSTQNALIDRVPSGKDHKRDEKHRDEGFLLSSDYFTIRRQAPKADPERLLAWQEAGRRNLEMTYVRSEFENGSESDEHIRSDPSDDDGYNVVIADNCQRVFVYGLKLLWTIENRNAVWSFVGGISKAFEPPKPSPSRQYTQRKLHEENQKDSCPETHQGEMSRSSASPGRNLPSQPMEMAKPPSSPSHSLKIEKSDDRVGIVETIESEEEGTRHFMVNVIEPQFNLHSEDANGRFLLAAVSGRVLARSFHSVMRVGVEVIEQALGSGSVQIPDSSPEMTWTRMEVSVMLEHVQAHVAPTDVDPGAGLQWLPKIRRNSPKVKRTGALLERVFMPCDMYFRYTRHKGIVETIESEEEGTRHFMVNVIEPQFNLHSEDANGRFLLAAVSGRVLARSFHSVMRVGVEVIEQALGSGSVQIPDSSPEMTWTRMEVSVMLEHVQAHVAPTDVDPGAGLQWLPKIRRNSPKVKRTGALLERVFMPCDMYFRYTRHKGGTPDLKVKPLKELTFNSHNIIATMTSRQFQVMLDVLTNLLFARLPKPRKSSLQCPTEDEDVEEEADEVVPYGVEEVELAKINLEEKERERKLLLDDIRKLSHCSDNTDDTHMEREGELWMISTRRSILVQGLKKELTYAQKSRKAASASLRMALQKAAQLRIMEKEKNKSPSYAMCISLQINKVVWSMLVDGKSFAEAEINDLIYDFDRDYKDIGVARFTTKYFVVRNCLPNAKSDMLLSAWNPPPEWGKKVMLRVDAKQGAPKDGHYPLELFHVEIYPLRIHLTETMYRMMWEYFFPEEEQDSQRRQEVWKISTTAGSKRVKKGLAGHESSGTTSHALRDVEASRVSSAALSSTAIVQSQTNADSVQKPNILSLRSSTGGSAQELRRTSSFDRSWEENVAESVANELVLQAHSCTVSSSIEQQEDSSKQKAKEMKTVKSGRSSHEEKKAGKSHEEKKSRPRKMMEFHNIKISQVELLVTYEGSRFVVNDLKLLMDTFHRVEFTGTWRRLFSRVKKHIIWGVLKSVTGMQGKKFKDKSHNNRESTDNDLNLSDNDQTGKPDQQQVTWFKRQSDGAGDGFVTSIRGLFNTQRRKAKAFVLRTMRGEAENDFHGDWSDSDVEFSPFARQLTITKAKKLIRRHTKKFRPRSQRGSTSQQRESLPSSPRETTAFESGYSSGSSPYEDFRD
ncbi:PREDICTED: protein SABRE-like [Camelina sativa]|uniref:Protein SABRE-like n=1 Tax=Camelina sativa TaxID=90675 RepID=A0ABM0ZBS9_CAMSA|nr:PREDICTED: protein SABRE-like [Camelina sativa]